MDKASNILGNTGSNAILKQLSSIIDKTQLSPTFAGDSSIRYGKIDELFWGLNVRTCYKTYVAGKEDFVRKDIDSLINFYPKNCYLQLGQTSVARDFYLYSTLGHAFNTIRLLDDESLYSHIKQDEIETTVNPDGTTTITTKPNKWTKSYVDKLVSKRDRIVELIKNSKLFKSYDDVVVPEDWNKKFEEKNKVLEEKEKIEKLTPKELRALNSETIVYNLWRNSLYFDAIKGTDVSKYNPFIPTKHIIKVSELKDCPENLYYGFLKDNTVAFATAILWKNHDDKGIRKWELDREGIKFYSVSSSIPKKFLKNHKHIDKFFKVESETKKTMAKELVEWTTAKYIRENLDQLKFMRNYKLFNQEIAELYGEVHKYSCAFYHESAGQYIKNYPNGEVFLDGVLEYTSKVTELQLFIRDHKDKPDEIQRKSAELFGIDTVTESIGYNLDMYDKMQILLNYAEPVKALFNYVTLLTAVDNPSIDSSTERMIREVIDLKGLQTYSLPKIGSVIASNDEIEPAEITKEEV